MIKSDRERINGILEALLMTGILILILVSGIYSSFSKPIEASKVQDYYAEISVNSMWPIELRELLLPLLEDGMSTLDYMEFVELISVYCGNEPKSMIAKQLMLFQLAVIDWATFGLFSEYPMYILVSGQPLTDHLDGTLCKQWGGTGATL